MKEIPEVVTLDLTEDQTKALSSLFERVEAEYKAGKPGMVISQAIKPDGLPAFAKFAFIEHGRAILLKKEMDKVLLGAAQKKENNL